MANVICIGIMCQWRRVCISRYFENIHFTITEGTGNTGSIDNQQWIMLTPHFIFNNSLLFPHVTLSFEPDSSGGPLGLIDLNVSDSYTLK